MLLITENNLMSPAPIICNTNNGDNITIGTVKLAAEINKPLNPDSQNDIIPPNIIPNTITLLGTIYNLKSKNTEINNIITIAPNLIYASLPSQVIFVFLIYYKFYLLSSDIINIYLIHSKYIDSAYNNIKPGVPKIPSVIVDIPLIPTVELIP